MRQGKLKKRYIKEIIPSFPKKKNDSLLEEIGIQVITT